MIPFFEYPKVTENPVFYSGILYSMYFSTNIKKCGENS
jgi:hypothetical protein